VEILEQITMVFFVLALLGGMLWAFRSKGLATFRFARKSSSPGRQLEVVERLPLTPNHSVHLIRMGNRTLLIGVAPGGCTLLEKCDDAPAVFKKQPYFDTQ
jgi:flagellar biosynthetic protein FliO